MFAIGVLKDVNKWLSGGRSRPDNLRTATVKLKVFNKRLMRQVKKLDMSAKLARDKAVQLRKQGDLEGSKFHARNYLQVKKQSRAIDAFRTNLEGMTFKLEQAKAVGDVAEIMKGIASSVSNLKTHLSLPQVTELMSGIGADIEEFNVASEITSDASEEILIDTAVTDSDVSDVLNEIDAEINIEVGGALPSVTAGGVTSDKVKDLERELNRLKQDE